MEAEGGESGDEGGPCVGIGVKGWVCDEECGAENHVFVLDSVCWFEECGGPYFSQKADR